MNVNESGGHVHVANVVALTAFQIFQLCHSIPVIDPNLGFWVKPRSTIQLSQFVLHEYDDDDGWISLFRMIKANMSTLLEFLRPQIQRQNTQQRLAILLIIRISCTHLKLAQGSGMQICSELFAISMDLYGVQYHTQHLSCNQRGTQARKYLATGTRLVHTQHKLK